MAELEIELINDGEVLDVKFGEHLSANANAGDLGVRGRYSHEQINDFPHGGQDRAQTETQSSG